MPKKAYREEIDPLFHSSDVKNWYYEFEHQESILLTKEENEELGKESARIDGLFKGRLDYDLIKSANNKIAKRGIAEDIYNFLNNAS